LFSVKNYNRYQFARIFGRALKFIIPNHGKFDRAVLKQEAKAELRTAQQELARRNATVAMATDSAMHLAADVEKVDDDIARAQKRESLTRTRVAEVQTHPHIWKFKKAASISRRESTCGRRGATTS
jgi:hypothetical protein